MLTITKEDYLRAIYRLEEDLNRDIKIKELAEFLDLAKSTVSERITELSKQDLVTKTNYSPVALTTKGSEIAAKLTYKHRIIEIFLYDYLELDPDVIHAEAHRLEHAFSDASIEKMREKLGFPTECPHGQKIPDFKLQ